MAQHPNARLTPPGRSILVDRIAAGMRFAHVAEMMGISRQTAHRCWRRYRQLGQAGLYDRRRSRAGSPHRTDPALERRVVTLRRRHGWSPAAIAYHLGIPASTC